MWLLNCSPILKKEKIILSTGLESTHLLKVTRRYNQVLVVGFIKPVITFGRKQAMLLLNMHFSLAK